MPTCIEPASCATSRPSRLPGLATSSSRGRGTKTTAEPPGVGNGSDSYTSITRPQAVNLRHCFFVGLIRHYSNRYNATHLQEVIDQVDSTPKRKRAKASEGIKPFRVDRRLTPDQIAELVEAYRQGVGTPELCYCYQLAKGSVLKILKEHGVTMRRQPLTEHQIDQAVDLYAAGDSLATIGRHLGSTATTVRAALQARGIGMRPAGGSRPGRTRKK